MSLISQTTSQQPVVHGIFDPATWAVSYVVHAGPGTDCAIIDSVLDFDPKAGRISHTSANKILAYVKALNLRVKWILETHAHADHLTAAAYLMDRLGGMTGIGEHIKHVQKLFKGIFNLEPQFEVDGSQFDHLFTDGEALTLGNLEGDVMFVPGHTPACVAYRLGDAVFVGDTLFMPDVGTARCDFPGGDARTLYASTRKLLSLPAQTRLFTCHDYTPIDRRVAFETSVAEQRAKNVHVRDGIGEAVFVNMRTRRDASLEMPRLILPSVQVNIRAGKLPPREGNGLAYLKLPLDTL